MRARVNVLTRSGGKLHAALEGYRHADCGAHVSRLAIEADGIRPRCAKCFPADRCVRCGGTVGAPVEARDDIPAGMIGRRFCTTCGEAATKGGQA